MTISTASWEAALDDPEAICRRAIGATLARLAPRPWRARAEVSVLLTDDLTVRQLNASYRGRDRPTNVLSFPGFDHIDEHLPLASADGPLLLGDVVLAFETVHAEATAERKPLADHLGHLLVHGCLHLLGYDHQDGSTAAEMEALETEILGGLGIATPYATVAPAGSAKVALEGRR